MIYLFFVSMALIIDELQIVINKITVKWQLRALTNSNLMHIIRTYQIVLM